MSSVNVCYLLANDTVDDIIWYVLLLLIELSNLFESEHAKGRSSGVMAILMTFVQGCCSEQAGKSRTGLLFNSLLNT